MVIPLRNAIEIILTSNEKNIQLDFFKDNNHILLQIYRQEEVLEWSYDINLTDNEGLIFELRFNEKNKESKINMFRFFESEWFPKFHKFPKIMSNSYFYGVQGNEDINIIESMIYSIIKTVYLTDKFSFSLSAY